MGATKSTKEPEYIRKLSKEESQQLKLLCELSTEIRGKFLDQAIPIEWIIDDIISQHFCPEETRRMLYFSSVPPELTFFSKTRIFKTILEICYPDLLEKHHNVMKEIEKIRNFRNKIAHSILEATPNFLKNGYNDRIRLGYYEKGEKKCLVVKKEDIKEKLKACSRVLIALKDVQKEVIQRVQTKKE